ncbi:PREDICTED: caspase-10-like isoform X2 [Crocodylus porosus]|uniref:caspase-10-like isoform X2 n=1 Tax=Crocodylus porosus TaxID=8502 RepID=UPI00093BA45F|nr:PREDICTED: caspase-10-like isoform X2 [Crocodylus porosus]
MDEDSSLKFHQQLLDIDENLGTEAVAALKFLCSDFISFRKLETVETAKDIFQHLMAKDFLSKGDTFLIAELLYRIRYHFLLQKLGYTKEKVQENLHQRGRVSPYRQMLYELSEDITSEDLRSVMFLLRDQLPKKQTNMSTLELLTLLEKQGRLADNNLQMLEQICKNISCNLLEKINKYKRERVSEPQQENFLTVKQSASWPSLNSEGLFRAGDGSRQVTNTISLSSNINDSYAKETGSLREHVGNVCSITGRQDDKAVNITQGISKLNLEDPTRICNLEKKTEKLMMTYNMDGLHRGYCIIINNSVFSGTLSERKGSGKDAACQGKQIQRPVYLEADAQNPDLLPAQQTVSPSESIPEEADFLLGMATVDGYASFRHIQQGSWYIQALCSKLQQLVPRGEDILSILTEVNEYVSKCADNFGTKKQMPQPAYTLRKKLIFPVPKNPPPSQQ